MRHRRRFKRRSNMIGARRKTRRISRYGSSRGGYRL